MKSLTPITTKSKTDNVYLNLLFMGLNLLNFSENLKQALVANEMTQQQLADLLSTTQATISRWIYGINEPDLETLLKICLYLNETPNSLLGFDDIPKGIQDFFYEKVKNDLK